MSQSHFSKPGYYRIEVQGHLPENWTDRFGAMKVIPASSEANTVVTVLLGRVSDQSELSGILNSLYDLHLLLLSVQCMGNNPPGDDVA